MPRETVSPEIAQWLNLIRESPSFVLIEGRNAGDERIQQVEVVPSGVGPCWIAGTVTTAGDVVLDSVLIVSTDDGGLLARAYIWSDGWFEVESLPRLLGEDDVPVYPLRYALAVPLEEDRFLG